MQQLLKCPVTNKIVNWRQSLSHKEIVEIRHNAMAMPLFKLIDICKPEWTDSEAIMCLGRIIANITPNGNLSFLKELGEISRKSGNSSNMPINEHRFLTMVKSDSWDDFYERFMKCMKSIESYSKNMHLLSIREIAKIVYSRSEAVRVQNDDNATVLYSFPQMMAQSFYASVLKWEEA